MTAPAPALVLSGITKRFDRVVALNDVSLVVRPGTVHAVLGENGAGKTTLMHVAYGLLRPDAGTISVAGQQLRLASPRDAIAAGIGMVHQHFTLVPAMTVAENLALGGHGRLRRADMARRASELAKRTGFTLDADARVETLSVGAQQRVEIAKALGSDAKLLILDEPTAVLAPSEVEDLLRWLRAYVAQGNAAVLITHKLREAAAVADDVTVLRRGLAVHTGRASAISAEELTVAMIGESGQGVEQVADRASPAGLPLLVGREITIEDDRGVRVRDASFAFHAGEIIGVVAVEGAGQREFLRALAGRVPVTSGILERPSNVGFVPEDRHRDGVLLDRSLAENVVLRDVGSKHGTIDWNGARERTTALMRDFDVRADGPDIRLRTLSGGNQQKLVLARELSGGHEMTGALIVENPTRGLDVRATRDVHDRLRAAATSGAVVVLYSSDLDEVLVIASRVFVMFSGTLRETSGNRDDVGRAMLGAS